MKAIKTGAVLFASILLAQFSYGQATVKKQTVKVYGNCSRCKKKIEASAVAAGASYANWNEKTRQLYISYEPSVSNTIKIETAIAAAGYDTQDVKGNDAAYNNLEECCRYDRNKSITSKKK